MNRPTVRQLEYLVAVADHLHFRRAAEASAISQPALSAQILQLEERLGVTLFERDRRKVMLTPAGKDIALRARHILMQLDGLSELARTASEPLVGQLHLGVIPTVAPYLLPQVMPAIRREYPRLQLVLREDQTARLIDRLLAGKLDVVLLALPVLEQGIEQMVLFDEPFVLAMPEGDPLSRKKTVSEADLHGRSVLLLEDGHCLRDQALRVCQAAGAREFDDVRATSLGTVMQMVASGLGITLVPEMAADIPAASGLVLRPFASPRPSRRIGLAWRASSTRGRELRMLGQQIVRARMTGTQRSGRGRSRA